MAGDLAPGKQGRSRGPAPPPGWRVLLLNTRDANPDLHIMLSIEEALRLHPQVAGVWRVDYADALATAIEQDCDLLLAIDGGELDRGLCCRLHHLCGQSALWLFGRAGDHRLHAEDTDLFDRIFTIDATSASCFGERADYLPLAASPRVHLFSIPGAEQESQYYLYDVLLVGTFRPNRAEFLRDFLVRTRDLRIKIGLSKADAVAAKSLGLAESSICWRAAASELARMANRSRVVLTLDHGLATAGDGPVAAGPRLFEMALAGGFQLVDWTCHDFSELYIPGAEIVGFRGIEECVDLIRHFLHHGEQRLGIARAAQERTAREHLYEHRVSALLANLESPAGADRRYQNRHRSVPSARAKLPQQSDAKHDRSSRAAVRVLYVSHNHISHNPFGGVEAYVELLGRNLPERYEPLLYFPSREAEAKGRVIQLLCLRSGKKTERRFEALIPTAVTDARREAWFAEILHAHRIDIVHFQQMSGHPWSLPLVARRLGVPTVFTVLDFLSICTHFDFLSGRYCNTPKLPVSTCDACLMEHDGMPRHSQGSRSYIGAVLAAVDRIIAPSESTREILLKIYPQLRAHKHLVGERVVQGENGFKVPVDEPGPVVGLIRQLIDDPRRLDRTREQLHAGLHRWLGDHLQVVTSIYHELSDQFRLDERDSVFFSAPSRQHPAEGGSAFHWNMPMPQVKGEANVFWRAGSRLSSARSAWERLSDHWRDYGWRKTVRRVLQEIRSR